MISAGERKGQGEGRHNPSKFLRRGVSIVLRIGSTQRTGEMKPVRTHVKTAYTIYDGASFTGRALVHIIFCGGRTGFRMGTGTDKPAVLRFSLHTRTKDDREPVH